MHRAVHTEIRPKTGQDIGGGGGIEITETPSLSLDFLPLPGVELMGLQQVF